ncbi:MAG: NUMOD3 domain-containing DNA-binding protein [Nitrososphaeraceae archaeon]
MTRKKGWKHSEETKRKIGSRSRGKKHTKITKKKLSELHSGEGNPMYGKPAWNRVIN